MTSTASTRSTRSPCEGKDRIAILEAFLAEIAVAMGEECIYFETGEDAWLIYPDPQTGAP